MHERITIILLGVATFALLACGGGQPTPSEEPSAAKGPSPTPKVSIPAPSPPPTLSPPDIPVPAPTPTASTGNTVPPQIPFPTLGPVSAPTMSGTLPTTLDELEDSSLLRIHERSIYDAIEALPWVADGVANRFEWLAADSLIGLGLEVPTMAEALLEVPWLSGEITEDEGLAIDSLLQLAFALTSSDLNDSIGRILSMSWFADGISETESFALYALPDIANDSGQAVREMLNRDWFADGISEVESLAIEELAIIAYEGGPSSTIATMPFMDSVGSPDLHALMSLSTIAYEDPEAFQELLSHPSVQDGIAQGEVASVALLHDVYIENPGLVETLLNPDNLLVEERDIALPLRGDVRLTIIRLGGGPPRTMDILESAVRFSEEFMDVRLPTDYVLVLVANAVVDDADGHNTGLNIIVLPDFDVDDDSDEAWATAPLLVHEVAHYYWGNSDEEWIDEGVSEVMSFAYDETTIGYEWQLPDVADVYPCSVPDLTALRKHPGEPPIDCIYGLGAGLFLDLYRTMGDADFRRGFKALYTLAEDNFDVYEMTGLNRAHVRQAFDFHPRARDEIIPKWYGD